MNAITDLVRRAKPDNKTFRPPSAPAILPQLEEARAELAALQGEYDGTALAALEGDEGSRRLAELESNLADRRQKVATLEAAYRAAHKRDHQIELERLAEIRAEQLAGVKRANAARLKAADDFTSATVNLAKAYRVMLQKSEQAQLSCPTGSPWPSGAHTGIDDIRGLAAAEMFRVSALAARVGTDGLELPGSQCPPGNYPTDPAGITPLHDKIAQANQHIEDVLTGAKKA